MTHGGGGDLLQHRGRRRKVRRSSVEVEEAARVELTEMGGKMLAVAPISHEFRWCSGDRLEQEVTGGEEGCCVVPFEEEMGAEGKPMADDDQRVLKGGTR
jgi:hypothetical protein